MLDLSKWNEVNDPRRRGFMYTHKEYDIEVWTIDVSGMWYAEMRDSRGSGPTPEYALRHLHGQIFDEINALQSCRAILATVCDDT